jgi:hypothetical protein
MEAERDSSGGSAHPRCWLISSVCAHLAMLWRQTNHHAFFSYALTGRGIPFLSFLPPDSCTSAQLSHHLEFQCCVITFILLQIEGFPLFKGRIIFYCTFIWLSMCATFSLSIYLLGCVSCFHILATMNRAEMNMSVYVSLQHTNFISFEHVPRSGIAESYGKLFLFFEDTPYCFL